MNPTGNILQVPVTVEGYDWVVKVARARKVTVEVVVRALFSVATTHQAEVDAKITELQS